MPWPEPVSLRGYHVTLMPLAQRHCEELIEAVKDGDLYKLWYTSIPAPENMAQTIAERVKQREAGLLLPFAVIGNATDKVVGMTNYLNVDAVNRRVEIGGTWYRKSVQRSGVNTEAKLLLLEHAFETLDCIAVELRTHFFNHQSRHAIERIGAKLDGILRSHQFSANGTLRDTCVYSVIASEWPTVKALLTWQLTRPRADA
ncbi:MAG TPA: GNAT family protein [Candidatus Binataceae bacterium]|nr:GNAT family protein [Candidatus Binataceae bacterium]